MYMHVVEDRIMLLRNSRYVYMHFIYVTII